MSIHISSGRETATAQDVVVFLIGARINQPWNVRAWLPVAKAMPAMQKELAAQPELGCLHTVNWAGRTTISLQYWRDAEALMDYARSADHLHVPAWRQFNKAVRQTEAVGVWHETYRVSAEDQESIYVNMPPFGLGAALGLELVGSRGHSASKRLGLTAKDDEVVPH